MANAAKTFVAVVGVDYSPTGDLAFERALRLCQLQPRSTLHVVHVAQMAHGFGDGGHPVHFDPEKYAAEIQARLENYVEGKVGALRTAGRPVPDRVLCHVRWDAPAEEIAQLASDVGADLVVVGTHGRRGVRRMLMGSVAEVVARLAPCAVLIERPKGVPNVPAIEPPCPECLKTRQATGGQSYWCAQHSERHGQRHTYFGGDRLSGSSTLPGVGW